MKKFFLCIHIWTIAMRERETGCIVYQRSYLFHKKAKKDFDTCMGNKNLQVYDITLDKEPLVL